MWLEWMNSSFHNQTNEMLSLDSDWIKVNEFHHKLNEFHHKLALAEKILYILISIVIILGNTLVLLVIWRERSLHQPNKYFIACLAVTDLLVGISIGPARVYALSLDDRSLPNIHFCRFIVWIDTLALTASVCCMMFISYDQYLKISKPLQYKSRMTTSKSLKIIFIIWLFPIAVATYAATPGSGSEGFLSGFAHLCRLDYNASNSEAFYTCASVILFLAVLVMLVMYARIFAVAHQRQKMLRDGNLGETSTCQNQRSILRQDLKTVKMLLVVVGVFCFCSLPVSVWNILVMYYPNFSDYSNLSLSYQYRLLIFGSIVSLLSLSNSLYNPFIYACLDQTYREAFKRLFQKMMCRTRSYTEQSPAAIELHH